MKDFVDQICDRAEDAKSIVSALKKSPQDRVVLGVPPPVGKAWTVPLVRKIKNESPDVRLRVIEGFSGHALEWPIAGRIDAAVLCNPPALSSVVTGPLVEDELCLVGPLGAKDAPEGHVTTLEALTRPPMILPHRPHRVRILDEVRLVRPAGRRR